MRNKLSDNLHKTYPIGALLFILIFVAGLAVAQNVSILTDVNNDKSIQILAFGDSITVGVGDTKLASASMHGYPARLTKILNVPVTNEGLNGEVLATHGLTRLRKLLTTSNADLVIFDEGNSDAYEHIHSPTFKIALQHAIDAMKAAKKNIIVTTQYPTCCKNGGHSIPLNAINTVTREVARNNKVRIADFDRAWRTTCNQLPECSLLLTIPEGLHPNSTGYDVITQTILAAIGDIDIFSKNGASQLETQFHLPKGSVLVKPS